MSESPVLKILIGAKGGESIDEGSGVLIKRQLTSIIAQIGDLKSSSLKLNIDANYFKNQIDALVKEADTRFKDIKISAANVGVAENKYFAEKNALSELNRLLSEKHRLELKSTRLSNSLGGNAYEQIIAEQSFVAQEKYNAAIEDAKKKQLDIVAIKEKERLLLAEVSVAQSGAEKTLKQKVVSYSHIVGKIGDWIARNKQVISSNKEVLKDMEALQKRIKTAFASSNYKELDEEILSLKHEFSQLEEYAARTGATIPTLSQKLKKAIDSKFFNNLSVVVLGTFARALRQVYQNVILLDKSITDLQIATGNSRKSVQELITEYASLAKKIGATTIEVSKSADTWLRQGYSAKQANKLIYDSMMLSKLGQIESAEAARALTSAMKGYKVTVEDATRVVDKFTAVDMQAAVSAGDIATAMAETAVSANVAGVSMDKLIGYITTVAEVSQDGATSVGTFFKTAFARMGNIQAGKFVDDETGESLNDVERVLTSLNIEVRNEQQQFRNFGVVLDEIGKKWESYDNVQQRAIATAIAGTRQQEKFLILMENYGEALRYAETAANSAGTAEAKYQEAYLESIEAKLNALKASWESFSLSVLDSAIIKMGAEFLNNVATILTKIASVGDGFLVTVPAITAAMVLLGITLAKIKTITVFATWAVEIKKILAVFPAMLANFKAMYARRLADTAAVKGHTTALILNRQAVDAADKATKAAMATNPVGWILLVVVAIYAVVKAVDYFTESLDELREKAKASKESFQETRAELTKLDSELKSAADRILELQAIASDKITLVEQDELNRLEKLQTSLVRNRAALEAELETKRKIAELDAIKASEKTKEQTKSSKVEWWKYPLSLSPVNGIADGLFGKGAFTDLAEQNGREIPLEEKLIKAATGWIPIVGTGVSAAFAAYHGDFEGFLETEQDRMARYIDSWEKITTEQQKQVVEYISDLEEQTAGLEYYTGENLTSQQESVNMLFDDLYDIQDKIILKQSSDGLQSIWERVFSREKFKSATDELKVLANSFANTEDLAIELQRILSSGDTTRIDELVDHFMSIGAITDKSTESLKTFVEQIKTLRDLDFYWVEELTYTGILDGMQGEFDAMSKALGDIEKLGVLSASSMKSILETYPNLSDYFKETDNGYVLKEAKSEFEMLEKYVADSMQNYVKELELAENQLKEYSGLTDLQKEIEMLGLTWDEASSMIEQYAKTHNLTTKNVLGMLKTERTARENLEKAMTSGAIMLRAKAIEKETEALNKQKDVLKNNLDRYKDLINIRKDLLKTYKKELDYQKQLSEKRKNVVDLQTQLQVARLDTSAAGSSKVRDLEAKLIEAQESLDDFTLEHAIDVLSKQFDNELDQYSAIIGAQTEEIVDAINNLAKAIGFDLDKFLPQAYKAALLSAETEAESIRSQIKDEKDKTSDITAGISAAEDEKDELVKKYWMDYWEEQRSENEEELARLSEALIAAEELIKALTDEISVKEYHSGGFVGETAANEEFAKLMKGEFVVTPPQINNFMNKTVPAMALGQTRGVVFNTHAPVLSVAFGSVTKDTLPEVKKELNKLPFLVESSMQKLLGTNIEKFGRKANPSGFPATN